MCVCCVYVGGDGEVGKPHERQRANRETPSTKQPWHDHIRTWALLLDADWWPLYRRTIIWQRLQGHLGMSPVPKAV